MALSPRTSRTTRETLLSTGPINRSCAPRTRARSLRRPCTLNQREMSPLPLEPHRPEVSPLDDDQVCRALDHDRCIATGFDQGTRVLGCARNVRGDQENPGRIKGGQ